MQEPVKELIMQSLLASLRTISIANGFHTDVGKVERWTNDPMEQLDNIIIEVKQGDDSPQGGFVGATARTLAVQFVAKVRHEADATGVEVETFLNRLEADIHLAVMAAKPGGNLVDRIFVMESAEIETDEATGRVIKRAVYGVDYHHSIANMTQ